MDDASGNSGLARLTRRRERQLRGTKLGEALAAFGQAAETRIGLGGG
jgi:hypothetical protein